MEYKVEDKGNTEVAEQTFSRVQVFGRVMYTMMAVMGDFFLMEMLIAHDDYVTKGLVRKHMNPTGGVAGLNHVPFAHGDAYEDFFADVDLDLNLAGM
jgi:hypothetical protein